MQHLESSPGLPDILRMNYADGLPYVVIAEFLQGVRECSGLQSQIHSAKSLSHLIVSLNPCTSLWKSTGRMLFFGRNYAELDLLSSLTAVPGPPGKSVIISQGRFWPSLREMERDRELETERGASVPCWLGSLEGLGICQNIKGSEN